MNIEEAFVWYTTNLVDLLSHSAFAPEDVTLSSNCIAAVKSILSNDNERSASIRGIMCALQAQGLRGVIHRMPSQCVLR